MNREEKIQQIKPFFDFWDKLDKESQDFLCDSMYEITYEAGENIHNGGDSATLVGADAGGQCD